MIDDKFYDGCRKSKKDLPNDICNSKSDFCDKMEKHILEECIGVE